MPKAIVTKEFVFDTSDFYRIKFVKGDIIVYARYHTPSDKMDGTFNDCIRIDRGNDTYFGEYFDIETYTEEFKGLEDYRAEESVENISNYIKQMKEDNEAFEPSYELVKHVHVERCDGTFQTNKFMSNIPREDIIDVKPMENNTYLVIYAKEDDK